MTLNIQKTIAGVALAGIIATGGGVAIDKAVVTDAELHASINNAINQGKIPQVDTEKVSLDRVAQMYMQIAQEYNVNLEQPKDKTNLYEKIREKKQGRGEQLQPETSDVLPVG